MDMARLHTGYLYQADQEANGDVPPKTAPRTPAHARQQIVQVMVVVMMMVFFLFPEHAFIVTEPPLV
jgi:hypothetical protein